MTTRKAKRGVAKRKSKPIIVSNFDAICNSIANGTYTLSPNSRCIRLLRRCIHENNSYGKRACFEDFSAQVNNHPARDRLISEIVGSWYHLHYLRMWEEYWKDSKKSKHDPKFLLRMR